MTLKANAAFAVFAAGVAAFTGTPSAKANSIADVEGARAKERAGGHLTRQDRDNLRRYGRNSDDGYRYYNSYPRYGYDDDGYDDGAGVRIYAGPRLGFGFGYGYGPYDY